MKAPLKIVLKNFLDHVDNLEARKKVFDDQYETEFQELKKLTDKLKDDSAYQCSIGLKDVNRPKNRYKDIVPYDFSRVILPKHEGIPGSDYINASYIKGASGALAYIAAQGPLPNTVIDFWRMIWICDVQVIVMACNEKEAGKHKCEMYWPGPGEIKQYGNISIELVSASQVCPDFLVRTLLVKCGSEMRDVYQFHYTSWPDHGVPDTVQPILDLVRLMRDCQASETVPIVVHCSAGCGRTGTLCAVDYVWACLRHGKLDEDFSLFQIALELRRQRIAMIQTKEQYILAHKAVAVMFEQQLRVIDCHIYENLDEDGEPLIWKEVGKDKEFEVPDFLKKLDTKESTELTPTDVNNVVVKIKNGSDLQVTEKSLSLNADNLIHSSSTDHSLNAKANASDCTDNSRRNSESSYSRNSILSQHSNEDSIPFIDEDEVSVRPNCGRAYLNMPSCDSISKLVNAFDPFVDKVSSGTDDSSPDGDPTVAKNRMNDFQPNSSCKTLDKNAKFSTYKDSKYVEEREIKLTETKLNMDSSKKASTLNRGSYPPCSNAEKLPNNSANAVAEGSTDKSVDEMKSEKKVGKATVVRRPSISKLKAFFEKSCQRTGNEGSKRVLFRNNSHHVARADSAPPSLDCMDRSSAVEKESILKMVTRKFRSSSVRTEREMQSKQFDRGSNRKSASDTVKDGLNALTRTVSFTLNKTFKSYSPAKVKSENSERMSSSNLSESVAGIYKPKSPDSVTGNSMWYDKASLPRAVAIVKPTSKFDSDLSAKPIVNKAPPNPQSPDKDKTQETSFTYISKPAKLKEFFISKNKKDSKDSTTLWYNESNDGADLNIDKNNFDLTSKSDNSANLSSKSASKVLPFLPLAPWKKVSQKSPLSSPDSPKNSTFYTNIVVSDSASVNSSDEKEKAPAVLPKCPIPEEIIHLDPAKSTFWPSSSSTLESTNSGNSDSNISVIQEPHQTPNNEPTKNDSDELQKGDTLKCSENTNKPNSKMNVANDSRPAIPKKMIIGKNKIPQNNNTPLDKTDKLLSTSQHCQINESSGESDAEKKPPSDQSVKYDTLGEKNDLYINVNIKAMKNIEQIENTLRKNPRGAIIDLTSRESYSMEEELVNAVHQLSESAEKPKELPEPPQEKSKVLGVKSNSKFPGYEVIWPEQPCVPIQKSKSSSKVPLVSKTKMTEKNIEFPTSNLNKTGLCSSPPLRRSVNSGMALSKSQSCGNLDWSEVDDPMVNSKEQSNTPTKRLVNEAVVELNTLLNQLTTRTLSEDVEFNAKSKEKPSDKNVQERKCMNTEVNNIQPNDTVVDSVTLITKSYNSGSSPKEEEIVFHFPPPPRGPPPPKDESSVERFDIIKKDGYLVLNKSSDSDSTEKVVSEKAICSSNKQGLELNSGSSDSSDNPLEKICLKKCPQPAPRKSKQTSDLKRSSSYTNIIPPQDKNKRYENVFLEKYQTLSRLEIKPDFDKRNDLDTVVPFQKSPILCKSLKMSSSYVNIGATHSTDPNISQKSKPEIALKNKEIFQKANPSVTANNHTPFDKCKMIIDESKGDGNSVYGKICKISDKKPQVTESCADTHLMQSSNEVKRRSLPSKKTAPPPPNVKSVQPVSSEAMSKSNLNSSLIPKKLPSRKLEKAPPPPHLLQKSSSTASVPKKNVLSSPSYANFPPAHQVEGKSKLPAVHENVPNVSDASSQMVNKNIKPSILPQKFVNRGLSHSQSDVSVYLALKERKMQAANQERKILNIKSLLMNKKTKTDAANDSSSSSSDSSYERIFVTKCDQAGKPGSHRAPKEQVEQMTVKSYRKEVPVAPPRSKRRSTTEVQYTKVKAKDASRISSASPLLKGTGSKNSEINCSLVEEDPPAIPMKTRDAFEIPGEISNDMNKRK